ncbi:hypothetical protein DFH94DRAFT_110786 [Russula ochroleuca]|uniref:Uncharacterized protein n=1 Tax=Russula ochroleuca TaxID=152965 RepID=A0A9P5T5A0_9AGAM|nr:hypothetical protein DFH94DRAFT_110786 [Russula ochroleuca]
MTRSARHSETTISMIDSSNASLNDRGGSCTQRGSASSRRQVVAQGRGEQKSNSGAGTASPRLMPSTGSLVDEKSALPLSERENRLRPSGSSSTMSRFVDRIEASVYSLSSLRTIPSSWRSTLPRAHRTYSKIERGHDRGDSDSDIPSLTHQFAGASSQHTSSGNLWNNSVRRRRNDKRSTRSQNNVFHTSLPDILARFSHAMSNSTNGHHDPGASSSGSLGTRQSSYIPFPSTSEESSYPSPYSADAVAMFQAPLNKGDALYFDSHVKHRGILENHIQVVFAEAADSTSTSTSVSTTSARAAPKPRGLIVPLKRRIRALASSLKTSTRCKFPTIFHRDRHSPRPVSDDNDPVEYDIPCLAYITCLW